MDVIASIGFICGAGEGKGTKVPHKGKSNPLTQTIQFTHYTGLTTHAAHHSELLLQATGRRRKLKSRNEVYADALDDSDDECMDDSALLSLDEPANDATLIRTFKWVLALARVTRGG